MKIYFTFILVLLFNFILSQSLSVKDVEKLNYSNPKDPKLLIKRGFNFISDTANVETTKYTFTKLKSKEIVELLYSNYNDGGRGFVLNYYLRSEASYKKFVASLKKTKFRFSKRKKIYEIFISTYGSLYIAPRGLTILNKQKYYAIQYSKYEGKEIMVIDIPINIDTAK